MSARITSTIENKCKSCGVPYIDHLGLVGTCAALSAAHKRERDLLNAMRWLMEDAETSDSESYLNAVIVMSKSAMKEKVK